MSKWSKIKAVKTMVKEKKEGEEEEEEDFLYEILDLPDPKYKFKFLKPVTYFMRWSYWLRIPTLAIPANVANSKFLKSDIIHMSNIPTLCRVEI